MTGFDAPLIAADRFPVSLLYYSDGGTVPGHPKARVILTQPVDDVGRMVAWTSPEDVVCDTAYTYSTSQFGSRSSDWFVETADFGQIVIRTLGGCGCGDRLKHWTPEEFQPYRLGRRLR